MEKRNNSYGNFTSQLQKAHNEAMLRLKINIKQAEELEKSLKGFFGLSDDVSNLDQSRKRVIFNTIKRYYKIVYNQEFDDTIDSLDALLSQITVGLDAKVDTSIVKKYVPQKQHKTYIEVNTLYTMYADVVNTLNRMAKNMESGIKADQMTNEFLATEIKLNNLERLLNDLSVKLQKDYGNIFIAKGSRKRIKFTDDDIASQIKKIDQLYCECVTVLSLSNNDNGQVWETVLKLLSDGFVNLTTQLVDNFGDKTLSKLVSTQGSEKINSSQNLKKTKNTLSFLGLKSEDVEFSERKNTKTGKITKYIKINGVEFEYKEEYNPESASKQAKVDLTGRFSGESSSVKNSFPIYKISAKNWGGAGESRDFGTTQLAYAIHRTYSEKALNHYIQCFFKENYENYNSGDIKAIHGAAKFAVLLDTVMGFSQGNQAADTIVINFRHGDSHDIKVYSIQKIVDAAAENTEYKVQGYSEESVENNLQAITKSDEDDFINNKQQNKNRINRGRLYLQSLLVGIHFKTIQQLYSKTV